MTPLPRKVLPPMQSRFSLGRSWHKFTPLTSALPMVTAAPEAVFPDSRRHLPQRDE